MSAYAERAVIVKWLRQNTNLRALARAIEDGVHNWPVEEQVRYCQANGIKTRREVNGV